MCVTMSTCVPSTQEEVRGQPKLLVGPDLPSVWGQSLFNVLLLPNKPAFKHQASSCILFPYRCRERRDYRTLNYIIAHA